MKKLLLLFISIVFVVNVYGQTTTFKTDLVLDKTGTVADRIYLRGNGSMIDFMVGDVVLTQSSNQLSLSGGNMSLGANSLLLTGSIGATGARATKGWFTNLEITNLPTVNGASLTTLFIPTTRTVNGKALSSNITITASDVSLGNVTNESKATMFSNPTFTTRITTPAITIGSTALTSTASELNILDGVTVNYAQINALYGIRSNIQSQLDLKLSSYNSVFTGLTSVEALQIGTSANTIRIDGVTDIGQGYTFTKDGVELAPKIPDANQINITDIPVISEMHYASGDTSNYPIPGKIGDIYIDVTSSKIYFSKTAARNGWVKIN